MTFEAKPSNATSVSSVGTTRFPLMTSSRIAKAQVARAYSSLVRNPKLMITSRFSKANQQRLFAVLLALFVFSLRPSAAPAQQPDDVVRTDVALVQLNIGVVDAR